MSTATRTPPTPQLFDATEVGRALRLILQPGQVTELRILDATAQGDRWPCTLTGYFDDPAELVTALAEVLAARGIYFTPNPLNNALLARAHNRVKKSGRGDATSDRDVLRRHWLLIDCDPQRPAGISASDDEHKAALERARAIHSALHYNFGFPEPIAADSGNGAHLMYAVDLPVDDDGLIRRCLSALAAMFDDDAVKIDTGVFNPARIWKLYGSLARKGDSTPDRPHRMSRILSAPSRLAVVDRALLEELAGEVPVAKTHEANGKHTAGHGHQGFDIDGFLSRHNFAVDGPHPYNGGRKWAFTQSPMCNHHGDGPHLIQFASGALSAGCHHQSCSWTWHDLRAKYEPRQQRTEWQPAADKKSEERGNESSPRVVYQRISSAELATGDYRVKFLIDGAMVKGQPLTIGGPMKSLKTSVLIDAAVSLACGGHFLGLMKVRQPQRVLVMSGESGLATIQETALRISRAAGVDLATLDNLVWSPDLPRFASIDHLDALGQLLAGDGIEVLFCDPAYLAMPSADAGNLMAQGELLRNVAEVCQRRGVTLVLCHHTKRNTGQDAYEPLELQHLAWAGHAEFARQWWLVNRRERYEPGTGEHRLWLSIGGSAGHSSLWAADINEGTLADVGGRRWEVSLTDAAGARNAAAQRKQDAKATRESEQLDADKAAVCRVLAKHPGGLSKSAIENYSGVHNRRLSTVLARLLDDGEIATTRLVVGNNNRAVDGFLLSPKDAA